MKYWWVLVAALAVGCGGHSSKSNSSGSTSAPSTSSTTGSSSSNPGGSATGLTVTTTALPSGAVGAPYSETLAATGGTAPYRWAVVNGALPAGLTVGTLTGEVRGTPTLAGTEAFTVRLTDDVGITTDQPLSLTIDPPVALGPGTWTDLTNFRLPAPLAAMGCASVNGVIYTFGGLTATGLSDTITRFDPANQTVTAAAARLPSPRAYLTAVEAGGKVYLLGGSDDSTIFAETLVYDPSADTVTRLADMPAQRDSVAAAAVGTDLFVFGGAEINWTTFQVSPTQTIWKYDTVANTWSAVATNLPQPLQWSLALAQGGLVYLIGGGDFAVDIIGQTQTTNANYDAVYAFDPTTGTLTPKASLPSPTKQLVGGVINGRLYVCAGDRTSGLHNNAALWCQVVNDAWAYDPTTDTWATLTSFDTNIPGVGAFGGRALPGGAAANGKLYLLGGYTLPTPGMSTPPCPTQQGIVDGIAELTP